MPPRVRAKWRPPLTLIIAGAMAGIVAVPLVGLVWFRLAGNILGWAETAWLIGWLAMASAAILGFLLWRLVLRPVTALTAHARAVKAGRTDAPVPAHFGTPEFRDLGQSVVDMGETLQNRNAGLRAYADHVTHELKSPLTAIVGAAELLQEGDAPPEDRAALARTIREAARRMEHLLADLRAHAAARQERAGGKAVLSEVVKGIEGVAVVVEQDGTVPIPPDDLRALLTQLAQNAVAHDADQLTVGWVQGLLSVSDNGSGVPLGNQGRIFDPFFTTTRETGGTGMGLSIVRALVEAHGGQIALVPGAAGARFDITF